MSDDIKRKIPKEGRVTFSLDAEAFKARQEDIPGEDKQAYVEVKQCSCVQLTCR